MVRTEGTSYQNLNLDGIGDSDDEVYISGFRFGNFSEKVTVLQIHLGTGETLAEVFPVCGPYTFQTGKLFSAKKDAVILEIDLPWSNYGAANIFVLSVFPAGADPGPGVSVCLDTTIPGFYGLGDENILADPTRITLGTQVVDIDDSPLQGLMIYYTNPNGNENLHQKIYWTSVGWAIASSGIVSQETQGEGAD